MRKIISILLLMPAAAGAQAPPTSPAPPGCAAEFAWITEHAARNYSGFDLKTAGDAGAAYEGLLAELRPLAAAATTAAACDTLIARWIYFFQDGHLSFGRRTAEETNDPGTEPPSDEAIRARFADRERLDLTEAEARARIAARGAARTPLEGIWELGTAYRVAVVRDERPGRDYTMTTLRADSVWWVPGQVKATFAATDAGDYEVRFYMRDHSEQAWTARVARNVLLFDRGSPWFRVWPAAPDDVTPAAFTAAQNWQFAAREIAPGTVLVQIPTFGNARGVDSLFAAEGAWIRGAERLIIDLRGNGGGSDFNYRHLTPLIYTGPIQRAGSMALATDDNLRAHERLAADTTFPQEQRENLRRWIAQIATARGGWHTFPGSTHEEATVLETPRTVAILVDRGCASSCEEFLLAARQSTKVTMYGDHTMGVLDFGNVRTAEMPQGSLVLHHPTTRTSRLPHEPVDPDGIEPHVRIPRDELFPIAWMLRHLEEAEGIAATNALPARR